MPQGLHSALNSEHCLRFLKISHFRYYPSHLSRLLITNWCRAVDFKIYSSQINFTNASPTVVLIEHLHAIWSHHTHFRENCIIVTMFYAVENYVVLIDHEQLFLCKEGLTIQVQLLSLSPANFVQNRTIVEIRTKYLESKSLSSFTINHSFVCKQDYILMNLNTLLCWYLYRKTI